VEAVRLIVSVAAGVVFLGLAALTILRGRRASSLAVPTGILCLNLFAYLGFETLGNVTEDREWEWLEAAAAALAGPLLFHLALGFVGARRTQRGLLVAVYAVYGIIALSSLAPFALSGWASYPGGDRWALAMIAVTAPTFSYAVWRLVRHYRRNARGEERSRTQLFIATVAVGVGGAATDLVDVADAGVDVPQLAGVGMLVSAVLLTALSLRAKLVSGGLATSIATAALLGLLGVGAQFLVFATLGGRTAALAVATLAVTLVVILAAREVWSSYTELRERTAHLATLGRLSAQMAHDIRNPLAAIRGAAQYLDEELRRSSDLADAEEFLSLILDQTERLDRVVNEYRRLGRAEPELEPTDVDALVAAVVDGAKLSAEADVKGVDVVAEPTEVGEVALDPELVTTALENLVRNAIEACETGGGTVTLSARVKGDRLELRVRDDGPGMDARTRERAESAFFTTKAQGSGLGLAFARRVAEAHGGTLSIDSALGRGTTVRLVLSR